MVQSTRSESERIASLLDLDVLDTPSETVFDGLVAVAAAVCGVPISLISLIDTDRQWFKANVGLDDVAETSRDVAFCSHTIENDGILEIPDATKDPRFAGNPLVTGSPDIRFYAGATLRLNNGAHVGTLCVIDRMPKVLTKEQRKILGHLADAAVQALESRVIAEKLASSESRFRGLCEASPLGIFATDADGACLYTNSQWQQIFGLSGKDALGHGWSKTLHHEDSASVFDKWNQSAKAQLDFDMEFRIEQPDGKEKHVRAVSRPTLNSKGVISGHIGSVEDITEQRRQRKIIKSAHERMLLATQSGNIGIWDWKPQSGALDWTDQTYRLHGLDPQSEAASYEMWTDLIHPLDRDAVIKKVENVLIHGDHLDFEFRAQWRDGSVHFIRATGNVTRNDGGEVVRILGVNWDITPLRLLGHELAEQHELLRVTLKSIGDAVITTDAEGVVNWLNPVAAKMTGWSATEAQGRPLEQVFNILNEETLEPGTNPVATCIKLGAVVGLANHTILISRDGREYGIEDSAAPIKGDDGELFGAVLVFHDVTEQRRLSVEMSYRATHDGLTGLMNRSEFDNQLDRVFKNTHDTENQNALIYIDLDQFKIVNDTCGHSVGDQLLQQIARVLSKCVRTSDSLARLGGDEFGVILENCTSENALRVAQQICEDVDKFRFVYDDQRFRIGASVGLIPLDSRWDTKEAALQAADSSCYAAKEAGRNRVHVWFDRDLEMRARRDDIQWATRLEQALDENRFVLHGQCIKALSQKDERLHLEVLIRMLDETGSIIAPNEFLPAAERFHMATRIDYWVLSHAIEHLAKLEDLSGVGMICVNLSGQSIGDRVFHRKAIELLKISGESVCQKLCLEITETAAVTNIADAATFIEQSRALGVRIALDDFGAGASSFGYLKNLNVDILKIDGQFITGLIDDPLDDVAVRCFVDVAQVLKLKTVAEFVKTQEILECTKKLGVDYAQGYLLHQPEPLENLLVEVAHECS